MSFLGLSFILYELFHSPCFKLWRSWPLLKIRPLRHLRRIATLKIKTHSLRKVGCLRSAFMFCLQLACLSPQLFNVCVTSALVAYNPCCFKKNVCIQSYMAILWDFLISKFLVLLSIREAVWVNRCYILCGLRA